MHSKPYKQHGTAAPTWKLGLVHSGTCSIHFLFMPRIRLSHKLVLSSELISSQARNLSFYSIFFFWGGEVFGRIPQHWHSDVWRRHLPIWARTCVATADVLCRVRFTFCCCWTILWHTVQRSTDRYYRTHTTVHTLQYTHYSTHTTVHTLQYTYSTHTAAHIQ